MSDSFYCNLIRQFDRMPQDAGNYSPLALAYIGDAVYSLIIRSVVMADGNASVDKLHKETSRLVCAGAQAKLYEVLPPRLTEKEMDIMRRGRNAKSATMAKNATAGEYRKATGVEALAGYLYLTGEMQRLYELIRTGLEEAGLL